MLAGSGILRRAAIGFGGTAVAVVAATVGLAAPASAHVTVSSDDAIQGGFTRVVFRVPTESDTLATTRLEIRLPDEAPVASVSTAPVPGWTVTAQKRTLGTPLSLEGAQVTEVVSALVWTAVDGNGIKPGQFQEFPIALGPLPKVDALIFKVLQTYSDGTIVRWIEEPDWDGTEAAYPAPILRLLGPDGKPVGHGAHIVTTGESGTSSGGGSGAGLGFGIAGLVAGLAGLVLGGLAYWRTRRPDIAAGTRPAPRTRPAAMP